MARPRKQIDIEQLKKCAEKQWTVPEIAAFFKVSHDTIERRYASIIQESRANGCAKLRDLLWHRAVTEKSGRVLIHIADRFLGPVPRKIEINREQAIEFLEQDAKQRGLTADSDSEDS